MTHQQIDQEIEGRYDEIIRLKKEINKLQKQRAPEEIEDYTIMDRKGKEVKLSSLFGDKSDLIVVHNMGKSCPYCTLWADGFKGYWKHLVQRTAFALVCPDPADIHRTFAEGREWDFPSYSAAGSRFIADMGFSEEKEGKTYYMPGFSVFKMENGQITRRAKDSFGPGDFYMPLWHFMDALPEGQNGFQPKFSYAS